MSGPPPPFGNSWFADVGRNPNINRDPPPPPIDVVQGNAPPGHIFVNGPAQQAGERVVVVENQPAAGMIVDNVVGPQVGMGMMPGMGIGIDPFGGYGMGGFGMGMMPGMGMYNSGGLAPPRIGAHMKYPPFGPMAGFGGMPFDGMGMGMGMGMAGMGFPPPPIGVGGVVPPAFAPGNPLWAGGLGVGGLGMGMMGMGMGMFGERPVPAVHDNGNWNGPVPPEQPDITVVPGGVPAGVTHVAADEYTIVIQIKAFAPPWQVSQQPLSCEPLNVDSSTSLNRLIQVCRGNEDTDGWAITECIELGNGMWEKGITFTFGSPTAITGTLKGVGWTNARNRQGGQSLHIFCHKV